METASYCVKKAKKVTVIFRDDLPFKHLFGSRVGATIMNLFKENGVHFVTKSGIVKINGDSNGMVSSVELKDGRYGNNEISHSFFLNLYNSQKKK